MTASLIVPIQIISKEFEIYFTNLVYSLEGAARQNIKCEKILVDYMSNEDYVNELKERSKEFGFEYVRDDREDKLWSRGRALNAGIKHASGDVVLFLDADCVLPPNYVEAHLEYITQNTFTYSSFRPTTKYIKKSSDYSVLLAQKNAVKLVLPELCSHKGIHRNWIKKHGAFDEDYRGWGAEDNDLWVRLKRSGMQAKEIVAYPIHLWHPIWQELMNIAGRRKEQEDSLISNKKKYFTLVGEKVGKIKPTRKIVW